MLHSGSSAFLDDVESIYWASFLYLLVGIDGTPESRVRCCPAACCCSPLICCIGSVFYPACCGLDLGFGDDR